MDRVVLGEGRQIRSSAYEDMFILITYQSNAKKDNFISFRLEKIQNMQAVDR